MDTPTTPDRCDIAGTTSEVDPSLFSEHCSTLKPIVNVLIVKDVNSSDPRARADGEKDICGDETAVIIEQQVLIKPLQTEANTLIEGNANKEISDETELKVVSDNAFTAKKCENEPKMMIDEQNFEPSVDTCKRSSIDSQITGDNLIHAPLIDAPFNLQSDVIVNPAPNAVKSEKDPDPNQSSSLALLAQYDTEDDTDDDVLEVPVPQTYQNRCVEIDSDSSTSDVEFLSEVHSSINLDRLDVDNEAEYDDDDEDGTIRSKRQPKVKGELHLEDLPPIEDLHITVPEEECTELGKIHSIVEQLVLVNALPGTVPLDLETVLFRDKGTHVLGEVFDVLGQVSDPLYCIRFNSNKEIKEKGIEVGQTVYVAPRTEHTQFVVLANLMKLRGSDASWENDVEPPPRFIDYSDDEEERSAKKPNRKRQSSGGVTYAGRGSHTPRRPFRSNYSGRGGIRHPNQTQHNYNIVGNSWHSNFYQTPMYNQPQYRTPGHTSGGYMRPVLNTSPYQQPPPTNPGLVINPYAVYPPPQQQQQQSLFPPHHHHQPPPH